jgi:hypothetical protein
VCQEGKVCIIAKILTVVWQSGNKVQDIRATFPTPAAAIAAGCSIEDLSSRFPFFTPEIIQESMLADASLQKSLIMILCSLYGVSCCATESIQISPRYRERFASGPKASSAACVVIHVNSSGNIEVQLEDKPIDPFTASYEITIGSERPTRLTCGWISSAHLQQMLLGKIRNLRVS